MLAIKRSQQFNDKGKVNMQVSPSHSQRQLVSGKVEWGWRRATYPICVNFGFAGFLILLAAFSRIVHVGDPKLLAISGLLFTLGFLLGIYTSKSVVEVCRQNADYAFSQWQVIALVSYWLILITGVSNNSPLTTQTFMAIWWTLPAAILIGISSNLMWRSLRSRFAKANAQPVPAIPNPEALNIVAYSDQTVLVSPSSLAQQPRQFNSLILMIIGFFFWTMLDFSSSIRAIIVIIFTITGLTGFFTWQVQLRSPEKILHLRFSGLWGIDAEYAIDLRPFSRLSLVKLQEAGGELSWMQLAGGSSEITLPLAMTMLVDQIKGKDDDNDQLGQTLREEFHLAKQETECDSLGLSHVLLPQGAGILAGTAFTIIGGLALLFLPVDSKLSAGNVIAWLAVCIVSPTIARFFLKLVAPNSLDSDYCDHRNKLQPWEMGAALLLVSTFLTANTTTSNLSPNQILPFLTLIGGWLSMSIGVCIFAFVRRTPLWHSI
ncbi:MAG: hypothetical protein ACKPCM_19545 [Pseudanabaena sp.]